MGQAELFEVGNGFANRSVRDVTFQGKMSLPIHRWYRLTPSFSPKLADDIADYFSLTAKDFVLDPFSGVGTVPLCMKYRGIPSCSIELNPYLHFVGTVKTRTYTDVAAIAEDFETFKAEYKVLSSSLPSSDRASDWLSEHEDDIPRIHNATRWWTEPNLMQLVCLRRALLDHEASTPEHYDLLRMAVLSILIPVSNAKHNHVSLTFADKPLETVDLFEVLDLKLAEMLSDIQAVQDSPRADATVHPGNSKQADKVLRKTRKPTAVITSPPYPNRFSYARETRPHLFFFEFIESANAVGQLETDAIGGTWGKATSVLMKGIEPINATVRAQLEPYTGDILDSDGSGPLMAHYVTKYFNDIYLHAESLSKGLAKKCKLAYVIGNSKFFGNPLPSDEILAALFGHFGFRLDGIDRMRRRQSKAGLYEAVVFMSRGQ